MGRSLKKSSRKATYDASKENLSRRARRGMDYLNTGSGDRLASMAGTVLQRLDRRKEFTFILE